MLEVVGVQIAGIAFDADLIPLALFAFAADQENGLEKVWMVQSRDPDVTPLSGGFRFRAFRQIQQISAS